MPTRAIRDVELVAVGTWAASTGVTTITRDDLESILEAHRDGVVDAAPVKLGHRSKLNDELGDGAPAFGWVVPKAIRPGKASGVDTLVGDLVGIPAKLAEVAPTAYRRRSVEVAWKVKAGGKSYRAVLTAVSLLGVAPPAVKRLDDVLALYSGPGELEVDHTAELELVDGLEANPAAVAFLAAARDVAADTMTAEQVVELVNRTAARLGAHDTAAIPTDVADDAETPTEQQTPPTTQEARPMATYTDAQLRELLSLEADADVDAALRELATPQASTPEGGDQQDTPPASTPTGEPEAPAPVGDEPAPTEQQGATPELVTLSAANHAELTELAAWARDRRRAEVLDTAVREGRISPAERTAFAQALERDEAGTTTLLSSLAPRFATSELGSTDAPEVADESLAKAFDEFEARTFGLDRS